MSTCFYCDNGEKLRSLMIEFLETRYTRVFLNRDQKHIGRCVVEFKEHKTEYFELTEEERVDFFDTVSRVSKAIYNAFGADKINYATFGDLVPHVHMHIVPKYKDGLQWGSPFDDSVEKKILPEDEYKEIIEKIKAELDK